MRNIYKDEKDLFLVIEKEKRVLFFKNIEKKWFYGVLGRWNNMYIKDIYGK